MATILQYRMDKRPGNAGKVRDYNSLAELLAFDFMKDFTKMEGFFRFSVVRRNPLPGLPHNLIAEFHDGYRWTLIGFIDSDLITATLPSFEPKYKA